MSSRPAGRPRRASDPARGNPIRKRILTGVVPGAARSYLPPLALLAIAVALWEALVRVLAVQSFVLPAPTRIWRAAVEMRGVIPDHLQVTAVEALVGLAVAAASGVVLAVVMAGVPLIRRVLYTILVVSQTVPMVVLAPLLVIWFGFGLTPKVIVVALVGFFPIVVNTVDGLLGADPEVVDLVKSMGASPARVLRYVRIPAAVPAFFAGLKIAAAYSVVGAVIGEWVGASTGLGVLITRSQASFRIDRVFVAIALISVMSIVLFAFVHILSRLVSPWMYVAEKERNQ